MNVNKHVILEIHLKSCDDLAHITCLFVNFLESKHAYDEKFSNKLFLC